MNYFYKKGYKRKTPFHGLCNPAYKQSITGKSTKGSLLFFPKNGDLGIT